MKQVGEAGEGKEEEGDIELKDFDDLSDTVSVDSKEPFRLANLALKVPPGQSCIVVPSTVPVLTR